VGNELAPDEPSGSTNYYSQLSHTFFDLQRVSGVCDGAMEISPLMG
jgi:hypothetical protein